MRVQQLSVIYTNPGILRGQPIFRGTRVTFQTLLATSKTAAEKPALRNF
ncbi:MAG TPA: DUF433 domain-containing protein [Candidatus Angelobacter sp.]|nr:DUF433 domain-containing protein [Candidatus Angelobacter sp.]